LQGSRRLCFLTHSFVQIQIIQAAIRERSATTELMERTVSIDPNAGIFITMNPAGKG
jgi:dynein heavy chain 2, cytosolic